MKSKNDSTVQVAAALIWNNGQILIAKRKKGSHLEDFWEFPGGKLKTEESLQDCLKREVLEELDIEIKVNQPYWMVKFQYPEKEVELTFFSCEWTNKEPRALGCKEFKWVEAKKLKKYSFPPANKELIEKLSQ